MYIPVPHSEYVYQPRYARGTTVMQESASLSFMWLILCNNSKMGYSMDWLMYGAVVIG